MKDAQSGHTCAPSSGSLVKPLLEALGKLCNCDPKHPVKRKEAILLLLEEIPQNLQDSVQHNVELAFWLGKVRKQPLFQSFGRGLWGLTEIGVQQVKKAQGKNLTAEYLDKRIKETGGLKGTLWKLLCRTVAYKLPASAQSGIVEDHVHNCMMRLIARDSLRERLLRGEKIPDTLLASYAVRAAYTDIRDWGTNPVTREVFGARTERERDRKVVLPPISDPRVIWNPEGSPEDPPIDIRADSHGWGGADALEEALDFQTYMECVEDLMERKHPNQSEEYKRAIRMKMFGSTMTEILEEVPLNVRNTQIALVDARACVKRVQEGRDRVRPFKSDSGAF